MIALRQIFRLDLVVTFQETIGGPGSACLLLCALACLARPPRPHLSTLLPFSILLLL